jgi:hypothetical protein
VHEEKINELEKCIKDLEKKLSDDNTIEFDFEDNDFIRNEDENEVGSLLKDYGFSLFVSS